jgi:hypothetical protein
MKRITAVAVTVSVLTCLVPAILVLVKQMSGRFLGVHWMPLAAAFGMSVVYWPLNAYVWKIVLLALGDRSLPGGTAVRIWLTTQTCRWLPGGVWHYGSRTVQSIAHGVSSTITVASMALELLLTVVACGLVTLAGVVVYGSRQLQMERLLSERSLWIVMAGTLAIGLMAAAAYGSLRWCPQKYDALKERFSALWVVRPRIPLTLACLGVYVILSVVNGITFYAVIRSVSPTSEVPVLAAVAANALAWLVGLFAVMAPGGLVVREATLALQLGLWMPMGEALFVAVVWRFVQLVVELICVTAALAPQMAAWGGLFLRRLSLGKGQAEDSNQPFGTVVDVPGKP